MKRLNHVGDMIATVARASDKERKAVYFFDGKNFVATSDRLGPARMVAPGTVAVSLSGRQWIAVGGDRVNGATGWAFVSPYVDQPSLDGDAVRFSDNPKSLKIRASLDEYLGYYQDCKGVLPDSVILRSEQLSTLGALPGQVYKGVRLEVFL
ncbi:hypothetical protein [Marinobacter sp. THAF197a]|uniref:hypothetical protein n=1 Tax=Marinobacter sp. THAF197a TaxID=2587869 RepID=UPI0012693360|nr:hypothetical protein [Marinobacter sp. THAF197a]QFS86015.1 hypothetical protein FIV08_04115 [Marinobacter sp. THAF197a]